VTLRFTIDTCCVIDGAQRECDWEEVEDLVELAKQGVIELWLTAGFGGDQQRAKPDRYEANRQWLAERPVIRQTLNPARLDYSQSFLDAMVLVGDDDAEADRVIQELIENKPRSRKHAPVAEGMHAKIDDVHHLSSHRMQGNDIFVTRDKDMLNVRAELQTRAGIVVKTPVEALEIARAIE
jgi:hypothetical protein